MMETTPKEISPKNIDHPVNTDSKAMPVPISHDVEIMDRSHEPVFWGLFGFGGMAIAFALPALITCLVVAGFSDGHRAFHITEVVSHWWGAGAVFLIILGAAFHAAHRIFHTLHDFKIHTHLGYKVLCYGLAFLITAASAVCLGMYYFGQ
jgi:fumarate reductase subunit D